jgi:hypothetical protein
VIEGVECADLLQASAASAAGKRSTRGTFVIQTRAQLRTHHQPVDQGAYEPGQAGCINFGVSVVKRRALPAIGT